MRRIIIAIFGLFLSAQAHAQYLTPAVNSALFPSTQSAGQLPIGQSSSTTGADWKSLSGDATLAATGALTFSTVNSNLGSFGDATHCVSFTTNAKGLITAASSVTCTPAIGSITGLGTGVATALGNAVNTSGGFTNKWRVILSGLTNFYVSASGSDTAGCGTTIGTPCLTQDFMWSQIQANYDLACSSVHINVAHGTYTAGFAGNGDLFGNCRANNVTWIGDNASPSSVFLQPAAGKWAFEAQNGARYFFEGFKIDGRNTPGIDPVTATNGSTIGIGDQSGSGTNIFGCVAATMAHINPSVNSFVLVTAGYTIDLTGCPANPASHVQMDQQGVMQYAAVGITITGSQTYTDSFMRSNKGYLVACGLNFTAGFTGPPFSITDGGNISTCMAGPGSAVTNPSYFPGDHATVSMTLTAGSTAATVSAGDATTLTTLIGSNIGLYCVSSTNGFTIYNQIPQASSISGTTVTLAWPAQTSGAKTVTCGGFVQGAGHYYGSSGNASIPPQP